ERGCAFEVERVHRVRVVAQHKRAAFCRAEPETLLSERERILSQIDPAIHVNRVETSDAIDGSGGQNRIQVSGRNQLALSIGQRSATRRMLVFALRVKKEPAGD